MNKQNLSGLFLLLAACSGFLAGVIWQKSTAQPTAQQNYTKQQEKNIRFKPSKSEQPTVKIYLKGRQTNEENFKKNIKKAAVFFGDKVKWTPYYYFYSDNNPNDPGRCIQTENNYLCSLENRFQLNQNIREICAWELSENRQNWWQFIIETEEKCPLSEIDQCWQAVAKNLNLPVNEIQNCFSTRGIDIIKNQITNLNKTKIDRFPKIEINNTNLPLLADGHQITTSVKINEKYFRSQEINSAQYFISAICSSFEQTPEICQ
jgi:hypothetical protein